MCIHCYIQTNKQTIVSFVNRWSNRTHWYIHDKTIQIWFVWLDVYTEKQYMIHTMIHTRRPWSYESDWRELKFKNKSTLKITKLTYCGFEHFSRNLYVVHVLLLNKFSAIWFLIIFDVMVSWNSNQMGTYMEIPFDEENDQIHLYICIFNSGILSSAWWQAY